MTHVFDETEGIDTVIGTTMDLVVCRKGAEVIGLTWKHPKRGNIPILWRNGETNPPEDGLWRRHAPILFPAVGGVHGNATRTSDGLDIKFPGLHGFLRNQTLELLEAVEENDNFRLTFRLESNAEIQAMYPWDFTVLVSYLLGGDRLEITTTVVNLDDRPLPFQIGWHPGFRTPFVSGNKTACHLKLPSAPFLRLHNDDDCYLTGRVEEVRYEKDFQFTEHDLGRTYMFDMSKVQQKDRVVELLDPDNSVGVRVFFPDFPHLGVWSDPSAPFICIEPWQGMDDSVVQEPFDRKFGIVTLPSGASDTRRAWIVLVG